jgi:hypothetical protein
MSKFDVFDTPEYHAELEAFKQRTFRNTACNS